MPLINIHLNDIDKKRLKNYIERHTDKAMSDFVRKTITEKIKIEESISKIEPPRTVEIPDYIPKEKYVIFVNGAVLAVGNNPSDLAEIAIQKFPNFPFIIKYNGPKKKPIEYFYMGLTEFHG